MVTRRPAPANGNGERRPLVEVGKEQVGQPSGSAGRAPRARNRGEEDRNNPKPKPHCLP